MSSTNYSVIRYVADPARNEPYNVGILLWNDEEFALQLDEAAIARVIRDNPHLERDALLYLDGYLRQRLTRTVPPFTSDGVLRIIAEQSGFPVALTEPRFTASGDTGRKGLEDSLERLLARVVRPNRRRGGSGGLKTTAALQKDLKRLIDDRKIERNFTVEAPRSGVPRSVDFYANHGANLALDVVNFSLARADAVRDRADQEGFKIWDLLKSDAIKSFYVLPIFSFDDTMQMVNHEASSIVKASGGTVVDDVEEAKEILLLAVGSAPSMDLF